MFLKVMLGLLLTLPLGAYFTGTLVASQADVPERSPVVVDGSPTDTTPTRTAGTTPAAGPESERTPEASRDDADHHADEREGSEDDADESEDSGDGDQSDEDSSSGGDDDDED